MEVARHLVDLPGAPPFDEELRQKLDRRASELANGQRVFARHVDEGGHPRHTNRLLLETSPYLLQHAHNPVNWFPWSAQAFALARELNRPLFLSVGYSTCHWCHVMEEESFEDIEIATVLNRYFIPVKVDREQRPDVDDLYMTAVHLFTGGGGWPMTLVLTPDQVPLFCATYLPPRDGHRGAMPGLLGILNEIAELYRQSPTMVEKISQATRQALERVSTRPAGSDVPGSEVIGAAVARCLDIHDDRWGGFGSAPKFPQPSLLGLLLRSHRRTGDIRTLSAVEGTLQAMRKGGIHDHVGGGFHRYSTDERWLVPHFEKMLYDNAQLATIYLEAYQVTQEVEFLEIVREILDYLEREMLSPGGGFYSATDADSEGEEGHFFTWTADEIDAVLDPDQSALVKAYYNLGPRGTFEGRGILHLTGSLSDLAHTTGSPPERLAEVLASARRTLYRERQQRVPPHLDDKIIASWNGLTISALSRAALVLDDARYLGLAKRAGEFVMQHLVREGRLYRTFREDRAEQVGFLEDYAFVISGLLDLYEASADPTWLERALFFQSVLDEHFTDPAGGYFSTSDEHEELLSRLKPAYDGAEPAGNSVAAENLLRLADITVNDAYRGKAEPIFRFFADRLSHPGIPLARMLSALDRYLDDSVQIVLLVPQNGGDLKAFLGPLGKTYLPNRTLVVAHEGPGLEHHRSLAPILSFKNAQEGRTTAYVCHRGRCEQPTVDPDVFAQQIAAVP